jgi:tetratricopeptide (TPR) repeat protein
VSLSRKAFPLLLAMAPALPAWQGNPAVLSTLRGQVEGADGSRLWVELADASRSITPVRTMPAPDGTFEFRGIPEGTYSVRVTTLNGDLICERFESIHSFSDQLTIRIPKRKTSEPISGVVSYTRLKNPPPAKAKRAFEKAQKYTDAGKPEEARRSLEEAIRLFPEYTEAYSNLGVLLVRTGKKEAALESFEKAMSLGPESAILRTNYAFVLKALGRRDDALKAAKRAVDLDASYARGQYMLGSMLAERSETAEQAAVHLRRAAEEVPQAHLHLAQLLVRSGDRSGAILELEQYKSHAPAEQRTNIDSWVKTLRVK